MFCTLCVNREVNRDWFLTGKFLPWGLLKGWLTKIYRVSKKELEWRDARDLKSLGQKRLCGFESRFEHRKNSCRWITYEGFSFFISTAFVNPVLEQNLAFFRVLYTLCKLICKPIINMKVTVDLLCYKSKDSSNSETPLMISGSKDSIRQ